MELFECAACGLVYLDPMPEPAALDQLYSDAYDGASEGYFRKVPQKMRRARGRMRQIAALVPRGRFLDVGCNGGFMVEAARERGFEAHGVDLDPVSIAWAKDHYPGGEFFAGRIEDYQTGAPFDAVYCSEVIEHVHGANAFLAAIAARMRPGAVLYLTTPDISHWRRPRDITRWDGFCPPAHCLYFNPDNLTRLLDRHGLGVFRRLPAFKPGIKLLARRARVLPRLTPEGEAAVGERLGNVDAVDAVASFEVGEGPSHAQYPMVAAGGEPHAFGGLRK